MGKIADYPPLAAAGIDPAADELFVHDASAAGAKTARATVADAVAAGLVQPNAAAGAGADLVVRAPAAGSGNSNGGNVALRPGAKAGSGTDGKHRLYSPDGTVYAEIEIRSGGNGGSNDALLDFLNAVGYTVIGVCPNGRFVIGSAGNGRSSCFLFMDGNDGRLSVRDGITFGWASDNSAAEASLDIGFGRAAASVAWLRGNKSGTPTPATLASKPNRVAMSGDLTDYAHGSPYFLDLDPNGSDRVVNSLVAGVDGQMMVITHTGSANTITVKHQSGTGTAAQKIIASTGADVALTHDQTIALRYDATAARWRGW